MVNFSLSILHNIYGYKVTEQNIAPNTEINFTLQKDSNGEEYDNLTENQNIEEVELHLSLVEE